MPFGIVLLEQLQRSLKQVLYAHYAQLPLKSVGRYTQVAADKVLETYEDLELLDRLFRIEIFVVVALTPPIERLSRFACTSS